jgi:hypothetical protein
MVCALMHTKGGRREQEKNDGNEPKIAPGAVKNAVCVKKTNPNEPTPGVAAASDES